MGIELSPQTEMRVRKKNWVRELGDVKGKKLRKKDSPGL